MGYESRLPTKRNRCTRHWLRRCHVAGAGRSSPQKGLSAIRKSRKIGDRTNLRSRSPRLSGADRTRSRQHRKSPPNSQPNEPETRVRCLSDNRRRSPSSDRVILKARIDSSSQNCKRRQRILLPLNRRRRSSNGPQKRGSVGYGLPSHI